VVNRPITAHDGHHVCTSGDRVGGAASFVARAACIEALHIGQLAKGALHVVGPRAGATTAGCRIHDEGNHMSTK
jgi:hypothetical protein